MLLPFSLSLFPCLSYRVDREKRNFIRTCVMFIRFILLFYIFFFYLFDMGFHGWLLFGYTSCLSINSGALFFVFVQFRFRLVFALFTYFHGYK